MIAEPARSTRPNPELLFGELPASLGEYCPAMGTAPLISRALTSAALGLGVPFFTNVSRSTATQPATSGVAMLVPLSKKNSGSVDSPKSLDASATSRDRVDRIQVPGATTSGLRRRSWVGPRLENATSPFGESAWRSDLIGLTG